MKAVPLQKEKKLFSNLLSPWKAQRREDPMWQSSANCLQTCASSSAQSRHSLRKRSVSNVKGLPSATAPTPRHRNACCVSSGNGFSNLLRFFPLFTFVSPVWFLFLVHARSNKTCRHVHVRQILTFYLIFFSQATLATYKLCSPMD